MAWSLPVDNPSLNAFRDQVRTESIQRRGRAIPSGTAEQASVIIEIFFAIAQSKLRVLTGDLDARVYGKEGVIVEAKKFLANRERSLSVIFLKEQDPMIAEQHPLLASLRSYKNVHLFNAPSEVAEAAQCHCSVVDDHAYRIKTDIGSHVSVTAFGDPVFAARLITLFARLQSVTKPIFSLQAAY
jgi:hypothetical protein